MNIYFPSLSPEGATEAFTIFAPAELAGPKLIHWYYCCWGQLMLWGAIMCIYRVFQSTPALYPLDVTSSLPPSCDRQKCLHMLPNVWNEGSWGGGGGGITPCWEPLWLSPFLVPPSRAFEYLWRESVPLTWKPSSSSLASSSFCKNMNWVNILSFSSNVSNGKEESQINSSWMNRNTGD